MSFGKRISEARKAQHLSGIVLGEACGVSKQLVSHWENDRHVPNSEQLAVICDLVRESADYLLFGRRDNLSPAEARIIQDLRDIREINLERYAEFESDIKKMAIALRTTDELLRKRGVKGYTKPERAKEKLGKPKPDTPPAHGNLIDKPLKEPAKGKAR